MFEEPKGSHTGQNVLEFVRFCISNPLLISMHLIRIIVSLCSQVKIFWLNFVQCGSELLDLQ